MGSKDKKQRKRDGGEAKANNAAGSGGGGDGTARVKERQIIRDPRFASAHTDPRFRRLPKRETKVAIDSRFQSVFTDKRFSSTSAPVDKRGKRRSKKSGKDSLREYYRIEEEEQEEKKKKHRKEEDEADGESDEECEEESERTMSLRCGGKLDTSSEEESGEEESEEEDDEEGGEEESTSDEEEDVDTEEDDAVVYEGWIPELAEETVPEIEKETCRLAVVNMDWRHVSATDLYVMLSSFLPKDGRILSVAVYPSEFGLQRMKEEETHGPVGLFDGDKENEDDDADEEDEDIINKKLRAYEISRLKYYFAVVECDSSATADYLYKACDGVEFERSSNKLDLRFIPDSMEFKHPPCNVATEAPAKYEGLDYHSRALQLSRVNLSWDEDEPHRAKTLKRKFEAEQMAELELKEFLASDESESDDDEDQPDKKEKKKEKYRALIQSGDNGSDEDEKEEDKYQDMEVTFNTELEDLGKRILDKKDNKSETVWEAYLRKRHEKKKARKNKHKKDSSSSSDDDDDDYGSDGDQELMQGGGDDFFVEEPPLKRRKEGKKKQGDKVEKEAAEEASRAELELLLADENAVDGGGIKGYNIKRKGKKGKPDIAEEKIPAADLDDPRFSALFTSPLFSLDPTDPQFKRSAVYARQLAQKQKGDQKSSGRHETAKPQLGLEDAAGSKDENVIPDSPATKKEKYELSTAIRSVKMKIKQQVQACSRQRDKGRQEDGAELSSLVQRVKKKAKALAK